MIFDFIKNHEKIFPIEKMCKVLEVSSSGYYWYKSKKTSIRLQRIIGIKEKITTIYFETKQRYTSPRMKIELQSLGYQISRPESFTRTGEAITAAKYMKQMGVKNKLCKKFKVTTDSKYNYLTVNTILNKQFNPKKRSKVWVSDITYIHTKEGFLYIITIIDLYDRKIIGWSLNDTMSTENTILSAWRMATRNRNVEDGSIFHSDRGVQYANNKFTNVLKSYEKITLNMSRKGNC